MLRLENTNWVLLVSPPFMSREQLQDSAGSSTVCAVNSCQYHLRSLNDLKTQKRRWRNNNFQSLGSPLFHLFCLNLVSGCTCQGPHAKKICYPKSTQNAVSPSPPRHCAPLAFERTTDVTLTQYCL